MTVKPVSDSDVLLTLHQFTVSGLHNYWLSERLYEVHTVDGEEYISYPLFDSICAVIGVHICGLERRLGPREMRFMRSQMELSQEELSLNLGFKDAQMVSRAESIDNPTRYTPLQSAEDTLLRMYYLRFVQAEGELDDYIRASADELMLSINARRTLLHAEADDLMVA